MKVQLSNWMLKDEFTAVLSKITALPLSPRLFIIHVKVDFNTEVWWDGSKNHRRRDVSHEVICIRNWDGSTCNWLKISITYFFAEMAHFFRLRDGSKFEAFYFSNSCSFRILSHLDYFSTEKVSHLSKKTRDRDSEPFSNWAISSFPSYGPNNLYYFT